MYAEFIPTRVRRFRVTCDLLTKYVQVNKLHVVCDFSSYLPMCCSMKAPMVVAE